MTHHEGNTLEEDVKEAVEEEFGDGPEEAAKEESGDSKAAINALREEVPNEALQDQRGQISGEELYLSGIIKSEVLRIASEGQEKGKLDFSQAEERALEVYDALIKAITSPDPDPYHGVANPFYKEVQTYIEIRGDIPYEEMDEQDKKQIALLAGFPEGTYKSIANQVGFTQESLEQNVHAQNLLARKGQQVQEASSWHVTYDNLESELAQVGERHNLKFDLTWYELPKAKQLVAADKLGRIDRKRLLEREGVYDTTYK